MLKLSTTKQNGNLLFDSTNSLLNSLNRELLLNYRLLFKDIEIFGLKRQKKKLKADLKESREEVELYKNVVKQLNVENEQQRHTVQLDEMEQLRQLQDTVESQNKEIDELKETIEDQNYIITLTKDRLYKVTPKLADDELFEVRVSISEYYYYSENNDVFMFNEFCTMGRKNDEIIHNVIFYANLLCEVNANFATKVNLPVFDSIVSFVKQGIIYILIIQIKDWKGSIDKQCLYRLYSLERLLRIHYGEERYNISSYFIVNHYTSDVKYPYVRYNNKDLDSDNLYERRDRYSTELNTKNTTKIYKALSKQRIEKVKEMNVAKEYVPENLDNVIKEYNYFNE